MSKVVLMMAGFGAFGKIAATGDFVRHGLPRDFVEAWDGWLQQGIATLRGSFGANWQEVYFAAPLWRFSLAPGVAGRHAMLGVMMPSVDRVGRHFPLTLAGIVDAETWHRPILRAKRCSKPLKTWRWPRWMICRWSN